MSRETEMIVNAFLGSAALTSLLIILAIMGTLNPYHRPAIPLATVAIVIFVSTYLASLSSGGPLGLMALRTNLVNGALSIFDLIFPGFLVLSVLIMQASLRRRSDDPLIALSEVESGSE